MPVAYRVLRPFTSDGVILRPGRVVTGEGWRLIKALERQRYLEKVAVTDEELKKIRAQKPEPPPPPKPVTVSAPSGEAVVVPTMPQDVGSDTPDTSGLQPAKRRPVGDADGDEGNGEGKRTSGKHTR